jgi:hypothetical protein
MTDPTTAADRLRDYLDEIPVEWFGGKSEQQVLDEALAEAAKIDPERLARAMHEAKKVGGPWSPCGPDTTFDAPDFQCECRAMAAHLASVLREVP